MLVKPYSEARSPPQKFLKDYPTRLYFSSGPDIFGKLFRFIIDPGSIADEKPTFGEPAPAYPQLLTALSSYLHEKPFMDQKKPNEKQDDFHASLTGRTAAHKHGHVELLLHECLRETCRSAFDMRNCMTLAFGPSLSSPSSRPRPGGCP